MEQGWAKELREVERIHVWRDQLLLGFRENVEYGVRIDGAIEKRVANAHQQALVAQLQEAVCHMSKRGGDSQPKAPNKPQSTPPGNSAALNLLDRIATECHAVYVDALAETGRVVSVRPQTLPNLIRNTVEAVEYLEHVHPTLVRDLHNAMSEWVRHARLILGYDVEETVLADTYCDQCGGYLVVAKDASTDVRCTGSAAAAPCGRRYERHRWLDLVREMNA